MFGLRSHGSVLPALVVKSIVCMGCAYQRLMGGSTSGDPCTFLTCCEAQEPRCRLTLPEPELRLETHVGLVLRGLGPEVQVVCLFGGESRTQACRPSTGSCSCTFPFSYQMESAGRIPFQTSRKCTAAFNQEFRATRINNSTQLVRRSLKPRPPRRTFEAATVFGQAFILL